MVDNELWNNFLDKLSGKFADLTFNTWFKPLKLYKIDKDNSVIIIVVPMQVHKKMIEANWLDDMIDTMFEVSGINYDIKLILEEDYLEEDNKVDIIKKEDNKEDEYVYETNLNKEYTFDNFVVGDNNKFAKTASFAVAQSPGKIYNPLFIFGKSGIGKTHLMHAIGNHIREHTNLKVLYTTSEVFRDEYTNITSNNNKEDTFNKSNYFKSKYRDIDVLIIDDIQFLVGAEKTQQEFFHTFEELHSHNKQIIISSDRSPDDLKLLEERLRSRFSWGLPVDIFPPDFDLRCRIIKMKIKNLSIADKIEEDVIEYIANIGESNVRVLVGLINRLVAYTAMYVPDKINLEFAKEALGDYIDKNPYAKSDISVIQREVANYYEITVEALKGKKRSKNIAYPRMIAMYLSRMLTDESFPRIALEFGGKNHSTIIHACDKIAKDLKDNKKLAEIINEIKSKL